MLFGMPWLSWAICVLSVIGAVAAAWHADQAPRPVSSNLRPPPLQSSSPFWRLSAGLGWGDAFALEAGRYLRINANAWRRVAAHVSRVITHRL